MAEMKSLNGYEIVDAKAREDIVKLQENSGSGDIDLRGYATEAYVDNAFLNYENTWKEYVDNSLEGKQDEIDWLKNYGIQLEDGTMFGFGCNLLDLYTSGSIDTKFTIAASNATLRNALEFNLDTGNLTFSHSEYESDNDYTKTIAFVEDVEEKLGGIDAALDAIIAKQADVLGGDF